MIRNLGTWGLWHKCVGLDRPKTSAEVDWTISSFLLDHLFRLSETDADSIALVMRDNLVFLCLLPKGTFIVQMEPKRP